MKKALAIFAICLMLTTIFTCIISGENKGGEPNDLEISQLSIIDTRPYNKKEELGLHATLSPVSQRERISLNGIWKFKIDPEDIGINEDWYKTDYEDDSWKYAIVPSNWNYMFRNYTPPHSDGEYEGIAWYKTTVIPPLKFKGNFVKLHFGAVCYKTTVWINGKKLGEYEGDFLPFEFDVSDQLKYGKENVVALRIETINEDSENTVPPAKGKYDFWIYSGIHREVYLESVNQVNIYDVYVHSEPTSEKKASVTSEIRILNRGSKETGIKVKASICEEGKNGRVLSCGDSLTIPSKSFITIKFSDCIHNPKLWNPKTPNLYDCTVEIRDLSNKVVDRVKVQFGIRKVEVKDTKILVNGKPVLFRGANRHDEYPLMGRVQPDEVYLEDLKTMKKANVNALRTAHYCNDPRIYNFTDRLGFFVIEEIPCVGLNSKEMRNKHVQELAKDYARRMVYRDRNHPSIIIWSVGNEPLKGGSKFNNMLYKEIKSLDSTRLVTYARHMVDVIVRDRGDIISVNEYWGWYIGKTTHTEGYLDKLHWLFPNKPIIISEYGGGAIKDNRTYQDPESSQHFSEDYQCYHLKKTWEIIESKDYMGGAFIWVYADFLSPTRENLMSGLSLPSDVNPVPYHNLKGIVTRERISKNSYLTVMGMYGNLPSYNLTMKVINESGMPMSNAIVDLYLKDGTWCGNQKTNKDGKTILWLIPNLEYTINAKYRNLTGTKTIELSRDETVTIKLLPSQPPEKPEEKPGWRTLGFELLCLMAAVAIVAILIILLKRRKVKK